MTLPTELVGAFICAVVEVAVSWSLVKDTVLYAGSFKKSTEDYQGRSLDPERLRSAFVNYETLLSDFSFSHEKRIDFLNIVPEIEWYPEHRAAIIDKVNDLVTQEKWKGVPTETLFRAAFNELVEGGTIQ